jgi:DNA modification methylase
MIFAPDYERNEQGWIVFPDDVAWRKATFPEVVMKHLAKMHLYTQWEIIKYVSEPGEIILDPMSGTGTVMLAATMGRPVICIEIEQMYHNIQRQVLAHLQANHDMANVTLIHNNCKLALPIPCNHISFSPPYGVVFKPQKKASKIVSEKYRVNDEEFAEYAKTTGNVGLMNNFIYNQEMEKVYKLCYQSLLPNGTISIVTKDFIEKGERVYLTKWIDKVCRQVGFTLDSWHKVEMMGGPWQDIRRSKGEITVDDEDIMIWRKL